jgi:hypothetical protein
MDCFTDDAAKQTVEFIGKVLPDAAGSSAQELINLISETKQYLDDLPAEVSTCLLNDPEAIAVRAKYGITATTSWFEIEKTLSIYATLHFLSLHRWFSQENDLWQAKKYYEAGFTGATYLHNVFKVVSVPDLTDK